jgi:glycosyltransferase involved in cell wall biosynthesis
MGDAAAVSVIIPVYNGERYIGAALESVLAQTSRPGEILVIDDGSGDGTAQAVQLFARRCEVPLRYIRQENRGPAAARNRGLALARGEVIAFQDADDVWTDNKLAVQLDLLTSRPEAEVVLGSLQVMSTAPDGQLEPCTGRWANPRLLPILQAAIFRRHVFHRVGLLAEQLRQSEDLDWYIRALEMDINLLVHREVVLLYRRHQTNLTLNSGQNDHHFLLAVKRSIDRRRARTDQPTAQRPLRFALSTGEKENT